MENIKNILVNLKSNPKIKCIDAIEIFKIYYASIEKTADNRRNANSFYLTLNTGILAIIGFLFQKDAPIDLKPLFLLLPIAGILSNIFWYKIVVSYRQLNSAKFIILNMIEEYLPLAPYKAEWNELGEGKNKKKYNPLTHIEQRIPVLFIILYSLLSIYFIFLFFKDL